MNDKVRLDPDSLRSQGTQMSALGDRVGRTYTELRDSLTFSEGSWGDDDLGLEFAKEFKPHADQLLANLRAMGESLHDTAAGIIDAASQFELQDSYGAEQVASTLGDSAPTTWAPDSTPLNGNAGTSASDAAQPPVAVGPAANAPAAGDRALPAGGARPAGQSLPGAQQAPGQSTPQSGSQREDPSNRAMDGRGSGESDKAAADRGRRPPAAAVSPPAAAIRDAPGARGSTGAPGSTGARTAGPSSGAGRKDTPWGGQPPRSPRGPSSAAEPRPSNPRFGSPPRVRKPADEPPRDRRRSSERAVSDPVVKWLARMVAERHGVQLVGFDTAGLQAPTVRQFVAAVDRVLTDYPVIALDVVAIAALGGGSAAVRWSSESLTPGPHDAREARATRTITLDQPTARRPRRVVATAEADVAQSDLEIYEATLREFGRALDVAGGGIARRQAQHVLIAEYLRLAAYRNSTLSEVVRGYRRWRAELAGDATAAGECDIGGLLGTAFAQVVLRGDGASVQARTLHAVLVDAVARRG
jgi:hypothetical protein